MRKLVTAATLVVGIMTLGLGLAQPAWAADEPVGSKMETVTGTIEKLDGDARTLTVKGLLLSKSFQIAADARIVSGAQAEAALGNLRVGDRVTVSYQDHDGVLIAHRIELAATEKSAPAEPDAGQESAPPSGAPSEPQPPQY